MYNLSSDNESSFGTESETENEYFWNEESSRNQKCYTTEVEDIIRQNVDVTTANAIALNHHYQAKLRQLRAQLETLLLQCQTRLKDVDTLVDNMRYNRRESIPYRVRIAGYICGQPFFKDHELYPGPHNADYLYRKNVKKEFFPLDMFESTETHWTLKDKTKMKDGILKQVIEFLHREGELRAKMCGSTSKAEQIRKDIISYRTLSLEVLWPKLQSYDDGKFGGQCFKVDWLVISNVNVSGRHTASACEGMWNQYLKPGLRKGLWKQEEECLLVTAVRQHNYQDWSSIAQSVGNRSEYQCFVHFRTCFSQQAHIERKPWTPEEDAHLLRIVQENCIGSNVIWNKVVEKMPNRNKVQVYHRYKYTLTRPLKGAKFTPVEDCVITAYVQQYGDDFKYFPEHLLPGRTMKQVWARYNNTLRYVDKHTGWTLDEDKRLMSYIGEHLTEEGPEKISWSDCSRYLVNHSRASCRTRYYTIEKFLEKYPNATLEDVPRRAGKKLSTDITHENWMKTIVDIKNTTSEINNSFGDDKLCETFKTTGEWALYDQMKFCFRYQFGHKLAVDSDRKSVHTRTKLLLHLLEGFHQGGFSSSTYFVNKEDQSTMIAVMETPLDWSSPQTESKENDGGNEPVFCRIPPNYNTVLGLRGLCLNAYYDAKTHSSTSKRLKRCRNTRDPEYNTAVELFVDRFKAIFHWSMLLVKLNIDEIVFVTEEDQHAEAITISDVVDVKPCSSEQLPGASHVDGSERRFPGKPRRVTRKKHTPKGKGKSASERQAEDHNQIRLALREQQNTPSKVLSTSNEHSKDDLKISLSKKHAVDDGEPNVQHSFMNELIVANRCKLSIEQKVN
ncbi:uncharacterized protein LOC131289129 [Anopheles ziemanni]|uniref:uncharacterized protein LOC131289129 n=1 Tax=Anopheles ziemanni TaxID=345580 RepID=UPI0026603224|nr:uncharacterized protein LOC131289129 [Anopheles ziemanni]